MLSSAAPAAPAAPAVSVLMPIWNVAPYVRAAVRSIVEQSLADWELIVVDDCSDDGSDYLVEAFDDPRIRLMRQQCHGGIVAALNRAAREARGGYLARMDGDDLSHRHRLQRQLAFMQAHPELDLSGTDLCMIDAADAPIVRLRFPVEHGQLQRLLRIRPCLHHGTWMLKRSAFDTLRGYRFDTSEDFDFLTRMDTAGMRFGTLPEALYSFRKHAGNTDMRKGAGLQQAKTHLYVKHLYRKRRRGLPEAHDDAALAGFLRSTEWMQRLHHAASGIVRKSQRRFPNNHVRWAGYALGCVLSPYVAYRFFLTIRQRFADAKVRYEPLHPLGGTGGGGGAGGGQRN